MEAVAAKVGGKRRPALKRKGGPAVVIAIGAPKLASKPGPMEKPSEDEAEGEAVPAKSKAAKIAALQEKIAALKAELALLEDGDEMEDEAEDESEDESEDED